MDSRSLSRFKIFNIPVQLTILLLIISFIDKSCSEHLNSCLIHTETFSLSGVSNVTENNVKFCSYLGIPYANPPLGDYQFRKVNLKYLNSTRSPTHYGTIPPDCLQHSINDGFVGRQDCLFASVFVKSDSEDRQQKQSQLSPVVLWIHGGTFTFGSGFSDSFNPSGFVEQDILVVTFNYRLSVFGFFYDDQYPKNVGLDDQLVVLRWIKAHVKYFGGDPAQVTIMGWSAGSASVNYLMYAPEAQGLFHKAIAMSGSFLSPWAFYNRPRKAVERLCLLVQLVANCSLDAIRENVKELKDLMEWWSLDESTFVSLGSAWPIFLPGPAFPGDSPWRRMKNTGINHVPLLMGVTTDDISSLSLGELLDQEPGTTFDFPNDDAENYLAVIRLLKIIRQRSIRRMVINLQHAFMFNGVYKFVEVHSQQSDQKTFFYRLNYNPVNGSRVGVDHGHDLKLMFRKYDEGIVGNKKASEEMMSVWTSFIKTGVIPQEKLNMSSNEDNSSIFDLQEIKQNSSKVIQQMTTSPIFTFWDQIFNCLNHFQCDFWLFN